MGIISNKEIIKEMQTMAQLNEKERQLAALICEGCTTPAELTAKLKNLFSGALEKMLEAEMDEHLGYEKHSVLGNNSGNSRNGYSKKTIKSEWGRERNQCSSRPERHL
jgi:putative transposase